MRPNCFEPTCRLSRRQDPNKGSPNLLRTPLWSSLYKYKVFRQLQSTALVPMSTQLNSSESFLRRIRIHQRLSPNIILQYDTTLQDLQVWFWYVYVTFGHYLVRTHSVFWRPVTEAGTRVAPPDLLSHRVDYGFRAPCCLCACNIGVGVTESAVYVDLSGQYVAGCATNSCGYLSM